MAPRYVKITTEEMENLFDTNKGWVRTVVGKEVTFIKTLHNGVAIKVYTSLRVGATRARARGADAIRIAAVNTYTNKGLAKSKRVYRVPGWEGRLKKAVWHFFNAYKKVGV